MNTKHLRWALEIERTGSFTAAANNLFVAQSNLSSAIKSLEEALGYPIFFRSNKGVTVTPVGAHFLQEARQVLYHLGNLETAMEKKVFSIAVHRHCTFCGEALASLLKRHPSLHASFLVYECSEEEMLNMVSAGSAHFGVLMHPEESDAALSKMLAFRHLKIETFYTSSMQALVSASHPLLQKERCTANDFAAYPVAAFSENQSRAIPFAAQVEAVGLAYERDYIGVADRSTLYQLLQNSDCVFWTTAVNRSDLERYHLALIPWSNFVRRFSFVRPMDSPLPPMAQEWMSEIKQSAQNLLR